MTISLAWIWRPDARRTELCLDSGSKRVTATAPSHNCARSVAVACRPAYSTRANTSRPTWGNVSLQVLAGIALLMSHLHVRSSSRKVYPHDYQVRRRAACTCFG
jgi:hypothetical protein